MFQSFVVLELNNFPKVQETWFQQDEETSHTARLSLDAVRELLGYRVISRFGNVHWPPRSPDLSVCDFFLWGYLKSKVYTSNVEAVIFQTLPLPLTKHKKTTVDNFFSLLWIGNLSSPTLHHSDGTKTFSYCNYFTYFA